MQISFPKINMKYAAPLSCKRANVSYPNLKPLACDTVSFSGRAKLLAQHMDNAPNHSVCSRVAESAEPAKFYLQKVLDKYISPLMDDTDEKSLKKFPVQEYYTRVKSPLSIREKVVSKYTKLYSSSAKDFSESLYDEFAKYFTPDPSYTKEEVVQEIQSVVDGSDKQGSSIAYNNIPLYMSLALTHLADKKLFDFDAIPINRQKETFSQIIEELETSNVSDVPSVSPYNIEGIKYFANDIVGARIILRGTEPSNTGKVIDALKSAVENGDLKITSIENNVPDPDMLPDGDTISDYAYATDGQLNSLAGASNAELITNTSKSGYLAIHINVDLSGQNFAKINKRFDGFQGEIQIIGRDVEKLKEIEDLCYKLKDNKNAIKTEYEPFKKYFLQYYQGDTQKAFDDYTYALYLAQRSTHVTSRRTTFPSLAVLGFDKKIPAALDFNELETKKHECDTEVKHHEAQEALASKTKLQTNRVISNEEEVNRALKLIAFELNC